MNISANHVERGTVLMIDDEPFMMKAVQRILSAAGFGVHMCDQWSEVSRRVAELQPDIVLLDYHMPMLKGDDLCVILKRNGISPNTKILFYSSEEESFLQAVAHRCDADGYIRKQWPAEKLVDRLSELVH